MKTLLLNVKENYIKELDIKDDLEVFYDFIGCRCIDIVERKINRRTFDIIIDDEGLLKDDPKISAINGFGKPMLVGNLMFAHHDSNGNLKDLTDDDIKYIKHFIWQMSTTLHPDPYPILTHCEYR